MRPGEILFVYTDPVVNAAIAFRSLDLPSDLPTIHAWVNQPYAKTYWQMDVDEKTLHDTYGEMLAHPSKHSFIGLFNDKLVCQIDCYHVAVEELKNHVAISSGNCGLHILMLPPRQLQKGLTEAMLKAFIKFFFSFGAAQTLFGEPDHRNTGANIAAKRAGFEFQKQITLSYKTANLYAITKTQFHATYPII